MHYLQVESHLTQNSFSTIKKCRYIQLFNYNQKLPKLFLIKLWDQVMKKNYKCELLLLSL